MSQLQLNTAAPVLQRVRPFSRDEAREIVSGAIVAHSLRTPPVWEYLWARPSEGKTTLLDGIPSRPLPKPGERVEDGAVVCVDQLTPRTLVSGLRDAADGGLLDRLPNAVLLVKEIATFSSRGFEAVLSQLRRVYDGSFTATFGTGRVVEWRGRLTVIVAGTRHPGELDARLGARLLIVRIASTDTDLNLLQNGGGGHEVAIPGVVPARTEEALQLVRPVAELLAVLRAPVHRDRQGQVLEPPDPEAPHRLTGQLGGLAASLAALRSCRPEEVLETIWRVAAHTVPPVRMAAVLALTDGPLPVREAATETARLARVSEGTAWRALDDLRLLGLLDARVARGSGRGRPSEILSLSPCLKPLLKGAGIVP